MPPLDQLAKPVMSSLRKAGLLILRGYLIVAVLLITIKISAPSSTERTASPAPAIRAGAGKGGSS
jgi:hypothetical protein